MPVDRTAAARAIADFLRALGHAPGSDPELAETPERVADAFGTELLSGYSVDVPGLLEAGSMPADGAAQHGIVVVRDVSIAAVCPHHLLPSVGSATVAYRPGARLLGLGTLASLVDACARRLILQEQIGKDVVLALIEHAGASGAYCRVSLAHGCLTARGERQTHATVQTTAIGGDLAGAEGLGELTLALGESAGKP